jgi:hypothetical protein
METTMQTENTETKPKNVTCYIKYDYKNDNDEEVNKIFTNLHELKSKFHLKFSNHPDCGITMLIFSRDNFSEFKEKLNFSVSKYTSVTKYCCDQQTADKLKLQKDSFLRLHYEDGLLLFTSRTPLNVHKKLVKRVFKDSEVVFDKANLVLGTDNTTNYQDKSTTNSKNDDFTVVNRQRKPSQYKGQGQAKNSLATRGKPLTRGTPSTRGTPTVRGSSSGRSWNNDVANQ